MYANLSECLRDVDLTQHYTCVWAEPPTQDATQLYGGGLREIRVSVDATCILRRRKRLIVDDLSFYWRHHHGQRKQPSIGDDVRFAARSNIWSPKPYVVEDLSEDGVRVWGYAAMI